MKRNQKGGGFSKEAIASHGWYERLATIFRSSSKDKGMLELIGELTERLSVDSTLILHFPSNYAPQLIYGKYRSKDRRTKIEEYMSGHYALDPFYLRIDECNEAGMMSLREIIEESFGSSEYYKVHYRSAGLIDELCFCCVDGEGGYVTLSLSRAAGKERYSEKELEAARRISPIVRVLLAAGWYELSSGDHLLLGEAKEDQHRLIENARINFGRSILTNREYEILQLLLRGKSAAFISRALGIAINTTKVHRKNIYAKLNITSGSEIFTLFLDVVSKTKYVPNRDPFIQYQETNV